MEVLSFAAATELFAAHTLLAVILLLISALALCLSLHISYHEAAHRSGNWPSWRRVLTGMILTPLMGLSFHAYRVSHWNHHRYNNGLADFTTTWKDCNGEPRPQHLLAYCLSWPKVFVRAQSQLKTAQTDGDASTKVVLWSSGETVLQLLWLTLLGVQSFAILLLYITVIYVGWALVSLQNYGQHLPTKYDTLLRTTSFQKNWYNRILFNNGLHFEHHQVPTRPIAELQAVDVAELVAVPHLLAPLLAKP